MKTLHFFAAAILLTSTLLFTACRPEAIEPITPVPVSDPFPAIPAGNRIIIHFGTSTQQGCMYSFSNCIWIGWGASLENFAGRPALVFENGDAADQYFGHYFPLTADYEIDAASAATLGIEPQVIPAGFYPLEDSPVGKIVRFGPDNPDSVFPAVNPRNPQDNIGQLHNLALQVILSPENKAVIAGLGDDQNAVRSFILDKTFGFLEEAGLPLSATEQQKVTALDFDRNYADYAARQEETRLSTNDKKVLREIMDQAAGMKIRSPKELGQFVATMTDFENTLATDSTLDDPAMVLSTLSVLKYSRYYWFWHAYSNGGNGTATPASIPDWVWADIIGLELGGPAGSIVASALVYLDTH